MLFLCPLLPTAWYTWLYNNMPVNQCKVFRAPSVFYFSENFFDCMLFFVFLSCIPTMVIIFQMKKLVDIRLFNL